MYRNLTKPALDIIVAFILFFLTLPLTTLVFIILLFHLRGLPLFIQQRPGFKEKPFSLIKFKTMKDVFDIYGNSLPDEVRLTSLGKWIRKTSMDELPQLWNVMTGQMSFVGPRPLLMEYLPLYNSRQRQRHLVRPGISGWAQVNGRNKLDWKTKFDMDVWYVENQSLVLDIRILFMTIMKVLKSEGINAKGLATMEKFTGNKLEE